ncbi:hypothetical protein [Spiroplasma diminutum]|uniref:Transmembrane protein n=1 Tax=Spiroplasma diminutum CUAS-1 TaxID=1276221 RepID=S5M2H3_9MOLU|nr:hypothetical protein [Spiroplasma diminutum]AGR42282.1 hypothetical protein SDIMI_v3c05780 [Spiroplasma diminutum CUAS-1]
MKKFNKFLIKLKPYRRLYKIFWMVFIIISLLIFQFLMLTFSYTVPNIHGGFYYWFRGLHSLLGESRAEPNSAQGFIFAATIIGYIPIIPIIPVLYFTFANWYIQEKLSDKYIDVPKEKYLYWTKFIHFSGLAVVFTLIPGILTYFGGGGLLPTQAFWAVGGIFSNNFMERVAGISAILYYAVGCVFALIIIFWTIWMLLCYIGRRIQKQIDRYREWRELLREKKRAAQLEKRETKSNKRKKE